MRRGEVVLFPQFEFPDGGTSKKLLVVLNEATKETPYLLLLATSKQHGKRIDPGCHVREGYYTIAQKADWFNVATWIMFNRVIEYNCGLEIKEHFEGNLKTTGHLKESTINAIIACIKQSKDISLYQLSLLK